MGGLGELPAPDDWTAWIAPALARVREQIAGACDAAGRDPADVTLIAVSKGVEAEAVRAAYDLGQRDFGESRVQELVNKAEALPNDIRWHFIGKLQSNKIRKVVGLVAMLHSLESASQLAELSRLSRSNVEPDALRWVPLDCFVEVNIAEEPQKSGVPPSGLDEYLAAVLDCSAVRFRGLMTIGPQVDHPEKMREYFAKLRNLAEKVGDRSGSRIGKGSSASSPICLSMGMSGDFDVAIQEGATHVRVGTALFGGRH